MFVMRGKMNSPKEIMLKWIEAMNVHDAELATSVYHEDAINLQVAIGKPLIGKDAIRKDFIEFFQNNPDTFTKVENLFEDGEWVIIEWSGGATFKPTGKSYKLCGCGFFHIVDGKIKFQRGYWDKVTWFGQVGLPIE